MFITQEDNCGYEIGNRQYVWTYEPWTYVCCDRGMDSVGGKMKKKKNRYVCMESVCEDTSNKQLPRRPTQQAK